MKFKFSLNAVLKVREHQEQLQKQKLAEEVAKQKKINDSRDEVQKKLSGYLQDAEKEQAQNIHTIKCRSRHMEQVHRRMQELSRELSKAELSVSSEREKLAKAHKNLHIMQKVKEFELQLFSRKMAEKEQKFMDEIATQSFSR